MEKRIAIILVGIFVLLSICLLRFNTFEYAYTPPKSKTENGTLSANQIRTLYSKEEAGTDSEIELGKRMFFEETFGDEVFFSDIMGLFDGPFTLGKMTKALIKLGGKGTSNLKVEAAKSFHAGNISIKKGDLIDTGLDVAKGTYIPLGIKFVLADGKPKAGISCAACHAAVNDKGNVMVGMPNTDLNIGLTLAMATNTASYFTHTEMKSIKDFIKNDARNSKSISLPDTKELEKFTDSEIIKWPRGSNDTTIDFKNNPVQIPDSLTLSDHPYGWSGQGQIGPFKGLSAAINNAHSQNMDAISQSEISEPVLNIKKEVYLGTVLQNASNHKFRYDPKRKLKPSEFFAKVDPTPGVPGVNRLVHSATYPKISFLSSVGLLPGSTGYKVWEQINALSAFMNTLTPPSTGLKMNSFVYAEGERVFAKAGCISCHAGDHLTNNRVLSVEQIRTEPSRAGSFKKTELYFSDPKMFKTNTPIPLPDHPEKVSLKMSKEQKQKLMLSWAFGDSKGGYKTPSLYGLYYSAPYLHEGGVSIGKNQEMGIPDTLMKGITADPFNSLQALVDSNIRKQVIKANRSSADTSSVHVSGEGHEFWVDNSTGFTRAQQQALIYYLLKVSDKAVK
ncbi:electron transport protein [Neobacillus vireti]|uniref:electron transport protein n=1 Tax=Neobacillus vireti TaxID=220686 RepID=UPI0030000CC8